jgi:hypothetical protein
LSKGKQAFKKSDFTRAIRTTQKAGFRDFTAQLTPAGTIEIEWRTGEPAGLRVGYGFNQKRELAEDTRVAA